VAVNVDGVSAAYKIPTTGIYSISMTVTDLDPYTELNSDGIQWWLDVNNAAGNLASGTLANGGSAQGYSIGGLMLTEGDLVQLVIGMNANPNHDATGLQFTLTGEPSPVPEPASLSLLTLGVMALVSRRLLSRRA
jgi:hypothetical protein